ncbi:Protein of unknown function DUF3675, partial [Dillenia turbinata]
VLVREKIVFAIEAIIVLSACYHLRMGDHFELLVDRLLTESTLEAAIESNRAKQVTCLEDDVKVDCSSHVLDLENGSSASKMAECRICQDEDYCSNMESPCSCCGSLMYAHRRCVQRWCNEKGDIVCEICHQQFKPGYTPPPPLFKLGSIPMNLRGSWDISRRDLGDSHFIAMVSTDRNFLDTTYDEDSAATSRSLMCCHSVTLILMILLILRHTLPALLNATEDYSFPLFVLLLFRIAGIILPMCIIVRAITAMHRRQHQQPAT